jgi:uncharacterized repeat protein (TIGR03847 family)
MSESFELGDVDTFTAGAVGRPGQRTFLLQARVDSRAVTVKCEKQQVAALGGYLDELLDDLPAPDDQPHDESLALWEPASPAWVAGSMAVAYDPSRDRVVVVVDEIVPVDEEGQPDPQAEADKATLQVFLSRGQALAFARRAVELVAAGRPSCRFCGKPMDPDGHPCPRMN